MSHQMLKKIEIIGFKSFAKKTILDFSSSVTSIVGPNGSGKSNVAEAFRFALGEQSMKNMRGKRSEDLIFNGSPTAPRTNRAAVAIIFDNESRVFNLDFDEIRIERAVLRDGSSEYTINDSRVRLRDIHELLSHANIGESGHHIIAQGEADRILLANVRQRREMLEDALGLASYEFKKIEAQRKLGRTRENIRQVEALRRELSPHVHFLQKQVEKLERADETRNELSTLAITYFAIEDAYITNETESTTKELTNSKEKLSVLSSQLTELSDSVNRDDESTRRAQAVRVCEKALENATTAHNVLVRELGKTDGALEVLCHEGESNNNDSYVRISRSDISTLFEEVQIQATHALENDESKLRVALMTVRTIVKSFFERFGSTTEILLDSDEQKLHILENRKQKQGQEEAQLCDTVEKARNAVARAREMYVARQEALKEGQLHSITLAQQEAHAQTAVVQYQTRLEEVSSRSKRCEQDKAQLLALVGPSAVSYEPLSEVSPEKYASQDKLHNSIERLKIRLEEFGGTGEDIRKEYKEVSERENFLSKELNDLSHSADTLCTLIDEIDDEVAKSFTEGLARVNESFGEFFSLMFGGGSAQLVFEENDVSDDGGESNYTDTTEHYKAGVEVVVHIPRKRVQSLLQLSGGERALTSIALIFAMSQVNPPPFLILDETDAALDEANSRRYGDMIENLSKRSQLIVITHNRETMSRAGILYGITMKNDGTSKLLSVKFDDAITVAKR